MVKIWRYSYYLKTKKKKDYNVRHIVCTTTIEWFDKGGRCLELFRYL